MQPLIYDAYVKLLKGQALQAKKDLIRIDFTKLLEYERVWYKAILNSSVSLAA